MNARSLGCALLAAALASSFSCSAQEPTPAIDLKTVRQAADAALRAQDYTKAAVSLKQLTQADPKDAQAWLMLGYSLHVTGKLDEALPAHLEAAKFPNTAPIASYNVACVHALRGRTDEAFVWLDKAVTAGFDDLAQLRGDADFAAIKSDPRFAGIEAKIQTKAGKTPPMVFAQTVDRKNARAGWFTRGGSPAQISIDYTPVAWQPDYEQALQSGKLQGQKWRFGADFWTRLDNSVPLHFGAVVIPAGYWYLTLEQRDANTFVLAAHDPGAVRKLRIDAGQAAQLKGGIEVVLAHGKAPETANRLDVALVMTKDSITDGTLQITFGDHRLSAPFTAKIE